MAQTADAPAVSPSWTATPSKPKLKLPPGSCDAHVHVFGPRARYPFGGSYVPSDAPKETLFARHKFLGIERCVIVHSAAHGFDLSATADALAAKGGAYLGVALMPVDIADAELKRRDAEGFRGVRFHYMDHLGKGAPINEVIKFAERLADIGWHLQIHMAAERIGELTPALRRSPVPVVIDHMGRIDASRGLDQEPFRNLLKLMEDPKFWVKVSGADRATRQNPRFGPPYADAVPFARKLVAELGDRCVWGTDFPHPNLDGPIPDDGVLVDLLMQIAPEPAELQALMVDNPQRFYRFGKLGPAKEAKP
jgi:2-pyrone-4,6-dicarboxylate lactonase